MCLRFVFLLITRLAAWVRLSRREEMWKTAGISISCATHSRSCSGGSCAAQAELGGPGPARGAARRDTESPPPRIAAAGDPGHDRALAIVTRTPNASQNRVFCTRLDQTPQAPGQRPNRRYAPNDGGSAQRSPVTFCDDYRTVFATASGRIELTGGILAAAQVVLASLWAPHLDRGCGPVIATAQETVDKKSKALPLIMTCYPDKRAVNTAPPPNWAKAFRYGYPVTGQLAAVLRLPAPVPGR